MIKGSVLSFSKKSQKFGVFCALEALNGAWECDFMSLPAFLLVLTLRILLKNWSFLSCGSGATLGISRAIQTRREEEDGARAPRVWKRKRETFILRSAQLLRGTGDYRWIFHDRKDYALEFFALYLSDSLCTLHATQTKSATVLNTEISFSHTYAKGAKMTKCNDDF